MVDAGSVPAIAATSDDATGLGFEIVPEAFIPVDHEGVLGLSGTFAAPVRFPVLGDVAEDFDVGEVEF